MAQAQKPDLVFRTSPFKSAGERQYSRLLAAEVCVSAVVMLDTPCSEVVWRVLATHCIRQFPLQFPSRASPCAITYQLESTKPLAYDRKQWHYLNFSTFRPQTAQLDLLAEGLSPISRGNYAIYSKIVSYCPVTMASRYQVSDLSEHTHRSDWKKWRSEVDGKTNHGKVGREKTVTYYKPNQKSETNG